MRIREYNSYTDQEFLDKFGYDKWLHKKEAMKKWKDVWAVMKKARPGMIIRLHHTDIVDPNYELWQDTIPMYQDEHVALHQKLAPFNKGKTWWTNDTEEFYGKECPDGWYKGRKPECGKWIAENMPRINKERIHSPERNKKIGNFGKMCFIQNDGVKTYKLLEPIVGLYEGYPKGTFKGRPKGSKDKTKRRKNAESKA